MTSHTASRMPAIFFGHGSPMNTLERNRYTEAWRQLGARVGKPKAILAISAHWYTSGTAVTAMEQPKTIHDFYGFPQTLFDVQYPAPGDPALAARVRELLEPVQARLDVFWGPHPSPLFWLLHPHPHGQIPVCLMGDDGSRSPQSHLPIRKPL